MRGDRYERAAEALDDELERGDLTPEEHRRELRELQREMREEAEEAARDAYDREMERW